ncbi:MAG: peptide deformylase [Cyanobacteria bacterium REEB65]|nr:peptide deformylase [Cyanobacteria bacterium REEB65]
MMRLQIAKIGNPILRQIAQSVGAAELAERGTQQLIDDMIETMRDNDGIGLAAPQVFVSKQILVLEIQSNPRYPQAPALPLQVMVNPEIALLESEEIEVWEGCLSVDNLRGKVRRRSAISVRYQDRTGSSHTQAFEGFGAVVVQHEADHLAGKLFLDRMHDMTQLAQLREFERYWLTDPALITD